MVYTKLFYTYHNIINIYILFAFYPRIELDNKMTNIESIIGLYIQGSLPSHEAVERERNERKERRKERKRERALELEMINKKKDLELLKQNSYLENATESK